MHDSLNILVERIAFVSKDLEARAQARLDDLTKPRGSLGRLEEMALRLFLIQEAMPLAADPARIYTVAGDHGVVEEGVSLFPQEVTRQMVHNFLEGGAAVSVLAKSAGAQLFVVDAGVTGAPFPDRPGMINAKVAPGTANFTSGPAMSEAQCLQALLLGARLADEALEDGVRTVCPGEMGIGNTTPATAMYCALFDLDPEEITGPGTGLDFDGVRRKGAIVKRAVEANARYVDQALGPERAFRVLSALGGYEIACMAGLILGAAANRQTVLVDGFISTAAWAAARAIRPAVGDYCFLTHASAEPGHKVAMEKTGQTPFLHLEMRLGEGTGAAVFLPVLRAAAAMFNDMATFSGAKVSSA